MRICDIRHPEYHRQYTKWCKWRDTYESGEEFIYKYLEKFTKREDEADFCRRRSMTYVPAFAKAAVNDIKNAIYQRIIDVVRLEGSSTYQQSIAGNLNGVDLLGSTMSFFIGQEILKELLSMSRVGVYVDMPQLPGPTKLDIANRHPYVYHYKIEDILSWTYDQTDSPNEFTSLLLRHFDYDYDLETNLPICQVESYRHIFLDGTVKVQYYNHLGEPGELVELDIEEIPFVMPSITDSLLKDVTNYQIALLNMESSDIAYSLLANYPFYTEQFDMRQQSPYLQDSVQTDITVGVTQGRRYPLNTERPGFIHPSSEPLKASMAKQEQLKGDIQKLVNLTLSNLSPKGASAESKQFDQQGLEAGLSYIGLVLQYTESKIGRYWSMYEGSSAPTIIYPTEYHLPDTADIRAEINQDVDLALKISSPTFKREMSKRIARRSIGSKIPAATLQKIEREIDQSQVPIVDPVVLTDQLTAGVVSLATAAKALGYPASDIQQARLDQAERLKLIQQAQLPATRGVPDTQQNPGLQNQIDKQPTNGQGL